MSDEFLTTETLERLSRQDGVDTKPILVRVLTDLFVQKQPHAREDIARYEELVSGLLETVGVDARAAVARKLADAPDAPRSLIARLLADDVLVCAPILARSTLVPRETLISRALDGGPAEAAAIASRVDLDDELTRTLAHHRDELVLETLAANPSATLREAALAALVDRAAEVPALAAALLRRGDLDATALAPLYLHADPTRRAKIRDALSGRPGRLSAVARVSRSHDAVDAAIVEAATATGRARLIVDALSTALGLKPHETARLATEASGEPFVMMLRAAGVSNAHVVRAMLIAQPEIAGSVPRFFELVEIAETTPRAVAAELVWTLAGHPERPAARHEPAFEPLGTPERAGAPRAAKPARRQTTRRETANQRR